MGANRDISKLGPQPTTVGGAFVWTTAGWSQVTKANVGLANADNTADSAKPVSVAQQAALDEKAPINSPQLTGSPRLNNGSAESYLNLDSAAGFARGIQMRTNTSRRWSFLVEGTAESGSNSGSNFNIIRYSDTNSYLSIPLSIDRASGITTLGGLSVNSSATLVGPMRVGQYTLTTLPSASAFSGYEIDVTNATGGPKRCRSNGSAWQILNTTTTVS